MYNRHNMYIIRFSGVPTSPKVGRIGPGNVAITCLSKLVSFNEMLIFVCENQLPDSLASKLVRKHQP